MSVTVYSTSHNKADTALGPEHRRMLAVESAISPEVIAARGYRSITDRADAPEVFANWQRRLGLLVPTFSPDGETANFQLRPNVPIVRKSGNAPKYETPAGSRIALDVNPLMREEVRAGAGDLYVTEGVKKVDALASRGLPAVGIIGVWNFAEPKTKSAVPLPCWSHVRLRGRRVVIVYDADAKTNANVHEALGRLVAMLAKLGAVVRVVYLPPVSGDGKAGVDDWLAAGGTVADLDALAQPFEPINVARERLSGDARLRVTAEELRRREDAYAPRTPGDFTARSIFRALRGVGEERGKLVGDGIRVIAGTRTLALAARVSTRAVTRALPRLEAAGLIRRDNAGRKRDEAARYVLLATPWEGGGAHLRHTMEGGGAGDSVLKNCLTDYKAPYRDGVDTNARRGESVPELRWSTIRLHREKDKRGRLVEVRDYVARLGKKRGAVIEYLIESGGSCGKAELRERFGPRARLRDFTRRTLYPLVADPAIIQIDGETVALDPDWEYALEVHRVVTEEDEDTERDAAKYARQSEAFRRRRETEAEPVPEMRPIDDMRQMWSHHPTGCACRECAKRFGRVIGEHVADCRCRECFTARKESRQTKPTRPGAGMLQRLAESAPPPPHDDRLNHALDCDCPECVYPAPRYATIRKAA